MNIKVDEGICGKSATEEGIDELRKEDIAKIVANSEMTDDGD